MEKINIYEYSGIVCPGAVFIVGLYFIVPSIYSNLEIFSFGAAVLFIIISFCVGNILQGIGNIFEDFIYSPKKYTNHILKKEKINKTHTEIVEYLTKNNKLEKLNIYNRQYGLMRGMCASFLCLIFISIGTYKESTYTLILLLLFCFSLYRAIHFMKLYTETLCLEYKSITNTKKGR